ncbi:hypothetical protein ACFLW6_03730 [Chloroflexota bacterium]
MVENNRVLKVPQDHYLSLPGYPGRKAGDGIRTHDVLLGIVVRVLLHHQKKTSTFPASPAVIMKLKFNSFVHTSAVKNLPPLAQTTLF